MRAFTPTVLALSLVFTHVSADYLCTEPSDHTGLPGGGTTIRFTTDGFGNYRDAFGELPAFVPIDRDGLMRYFQLGRGEAARGFLSFDVTRRCGGRRYVTRFQLAYTEAVFAPIDFQQHVRAIARQGTLCSDGSDSWLEGDTLIDAIARNGDRFGNRLYPSIAAALKAEPEPGQ